MHLQRELAGRRDDEGERRCGAAEVLGVAEQGRARGESEGDGLAGAGLGGDEQVAPLRALFEDGGLNGGGFVVVALRQGLRQGGVGQSGRASVVRPVGSWRRPPGAIRGAAGLFKGIAVCPIHQAGTQRHRLHVRQPCAARGRPAPRGRMCRQSQR